MIDPDRIEYLKKLISSPEYQARRREEMRRLGITEEGERLAHELLFGDDAKESGDDPTQT